MESKIDDLIRRTINALLYEHQHKPISIKRNYQPGFNFASMNYSRLRCPEIDALFFTDCLEKLKHRYDSDGLSYEQFRKNRKSVSVLKQYALEGTIRHERQPPLSYMIPSVQNEAILLRFLAEQSIELAASTVHARGNILRQFLRYYESVGQADLGALTSNTISSFMEYMATRRSAGLNTVAPAMRSFIIYLHRKGITDVVLSPSTTVRVLRRHRIHGIFTPTEIERILSQIDRYNPLGKRDYAIMLLSSRNGLRSGDILNLKLADIRWRNAEIVIVQKKTQNIIACPMDDDTGSALSDYILNARPSSTLQNVFLSTPPVHALTSANLCQMLKKYSIAAGVINSSAERLGMHRFRRSLATTLLENDVALETIAQILGHKTTAATRQYLSITEGKLAECALPMPYYTGELEVRDA